jgi:hypothetical protein
MSDILLLERRPDRRSIVRRWRQLHQQQCRVLSRYGKSTGERQSALAVFHEFHRRQRVLLCSRWGRRIDLIALLKQCNEEGEFFWGLADPFQKFGSYNGYSFIPENEPKRGIRKICQADLTTWRDVTIEHPLSVNLKGWRYMPCVVKATPPMPPRVRALALKPKLRKRARWIGLVFPLDHTWMVEKGVDPALVAEWKDRPGEYYALAVWGRKDRPRIMEFVD